MALLIDNDIVHKLAQLDLLRIAKVLLEEKYGELQILNTLRFKFCPKTTAKRLKVEKRYSVEVIDRIQDFIDSDINLTEIDCEVTDSTLIEAMYSNDDGLDIGEMQLLQALIDSDESCMFTGDKRFLRALANSPEISDAHIPKLGESFVCFEQIICYLINEMGFEVVKQHYIEAKQTELSLDATLRVCFGGVGTDAQESTVQDNLQHHVDTLRAETSTLLSISDDWISISLSQPTETNGPEALDTPL